jgi:hypothetical protein
LTTAFIAAVKDRSVRTFETRTKRVEFWKTMLDTAPLAEATNVAFLRDQCRQEMVRAADAVATENNELAGRISMALIVAVGFVLVFLISGVFRDVLSRLEQQNGAPTQQQLMNWATASAVVEAAVFACVWFWGRWRIRLWVWKKIKPGAPLEFVRQSGVFQGAAMLLALAISMGCVWVCTKFLVW